MIQIKGKSVYKGIAIGTIKYICKEEQMVKRIKVQDPQAEITRFTEACEEAKKQLQELYTRTIAFAGENNAAIFEFHMMMLEDEDYLEGAIHIMTSQQVNAEYAVAQNSDNFAQMFAAMEDNEYMQARSADVRDVSERLLHILKGTEDDSKNLKSPSIVIAEDFAPSETVQMDKSMLLSFVTKYGSLNSHTAILARNMGIPALIGIDIQRAWDGKMAIVDGYQGTITIEPEPEYLESMQKKKEQEDHKRILMQKLKGKPTETKDGRRLNLYSNISSSKDVALVLANDAEGIGLFRSEFLYLEKDSCPTEEEQFQAYRFVAESMAGKKVIIRTLDIGADKQADYLNLAEETNPALGYRAIRICLKQPDLFKAQLRAIYRASAFGNISIMFPMITSLSEVRKIKEILTEVKNELAAEQVQFNDVEIGIMIETPAAVMISDELAKEVQFFSIGTNDLTQYTLAIDRQNSELDEFYDPHHKAILKMIDMVVKNGHENDCWVGICGELGADEEMIPLFLEMGIDELSVSASRVLEVRNCIREL